MTENGLGLSSGMALSAKTETKTRANSRKRKKFEVWELIAVFFEKESFYFEILCFFFGFSGNS